MIIHQINTIRIIKNVEVKKNYTNYNVIEDSRPTEKLPRYSLTYKLFVVGIFLSTCRVHCHLIYNYGGFCININLRTKLSMTLIRYKYLYKKYNAYLK